MSILVAYATGHGTTWGIAERIAQDLSAPRRPADAGGVRQAGDLADGQRFFIGSAAHCAHSLTAAAALVRHNRDLFGDDLAPDDLPVMGKKALEAAKVARDAARDALGSSGALGLSQEQVTALTSKPEGGALTSTPSRPRRHARPVRRRGLVRSARTGGLMHICDSWPATR
jgi:hypothetical protein